MERITDKKDDLTQMIRPGTTWVAGFTQPGNNDDLRAIDTDCSEMRLIPASRYYASCAIKRGQALSIAQLSDLTEEQKQNKYAYVKITDPDIDETCIGIAMECAEEGQIVHIQSTGKYNFYTTDSILYSEEAAKQEIFLKADEWSFDEVRGQKLYVKKLYNSTPMLDEDSDTHRIPGDEFDVDHIDTQRDADTTGWFTYDFQESVYNAKNTIQIGSLTDAPTTNKSLFFKSEDGTWYQKLTDGTAIPVLYKDCIIVERQDDKIVAAEDLKLLLTGEQIKKGGVPPKAHEAVWMQEIKEEDGVKYYAAVDDLIVTIELDITGDTRGPLDNTQFLLTLGETIYFDTKKQNVELTAPHFNDGIYDEIKVVAIADGHPACPCFRFFLTSDGQIAYKKAEEYNASDDYYRLLPGKIYEPVKNLTAAEFERTYVKATAYVEGTDYYVQRNGKYERVLPKDIDAIIFETAEETYYYKQEFYTAVDHLDYAFVALRKIDGDTYIIPVLCNFTEEELANGAALIDANDEGYFRLSRDFTLGVEQDYIKDGVSTKRSPKITIGEPVLELTRDNLKAAICKGMQEIFVDNDTREVGCNPRTFDIGDEGFQFLTEEVGGSYSAYISSNLLSLISYTQIRQGQSAEAGTAILADIRDASRLNVAGIVLSNSSGVHSKGELIKVMKLGRMVTLGNLLPGTEYYLGLNGRLTTRGQCWYDNVVAVGTAESENYFIANVDTFPRKLYSGNLPLGYIKPSVFGMAEKGYVLADGVTRYNKDEEPELYKLLLNWFDAEELKPSNVTEAQYNRYEKWTLNQVFTDLFNKLTTLELNQVEVDKLTDIIALTDAIQQNAKAVQELNAKLDSQQTLIDQASDKISDLEDVDKSLAEDSKDIADALKQYKTAMSISIEDITDRLANAATEASENTTKISTVTSDLAKLAKAYDTYVTANDKAISDVTEQHDKDLEEVKNTDASTLETIQGIAKDIESNSNTLQQLVQENKDLKNALNASNERISELESTIDQILKTIAANNGSGSKDDSE